MVDVGRVEYRMRFDGWLGECGDGWVSCALEELNELNELNELFWMMGAYI